MSLPFRPWPFLSRQYAAILVLILLMVSCGETTPLNDSGAKDSEEKTFTSITWTGFPTVATVGMSTNPLNKPVSVPAADNYTITRKSGSCYWNNTNKIISFTNTIRCVLTVTATKEGYESFSKDFRVTPIPGDIQSIKWTAFPSSGEVGVSISGIAEPVSVPAADRYTITKKSGGCSWDDVGNTLSFTNATECVLTVTTTKSGYNPLSKDFRLTPMARDIQTLSWTAFPSSGVVGTPITGIAAPISVPAADDYTIAKKSGDCSWDDVGNTLSFTNTTECILTVTTTKVGYNPFSKDFRLTPTAGTIQSLAWTAFPSSGVVGMPITGIAAPVSVPAADRYAIAKKSGDCSWNNGSSTLSFTNTTACVLTVTTTKAGYNTFSKDFTVTPISGTIQSLSWAAFPSSGVVGMAITGIAAPVSVPAADRYSIAKKSGACSWYDPNDTLSFTNTTECIITVTTTKAGYNPFSKDFSITPSAGTIQSLAWTAFPSSGVVGTAITAIADPVSVPSANSYDIAKKSGDCAWDDVNNDLSFTNTTECVLTVTTTKTGFNPFSKDFRLTPTAGTIQSLAWTAFPSSGVVGTAITAIAAPVSVPAADDYTIAKKSGDCAWNDANDSLSFTNTTQCTITVTTSKTGYNPLSKDFTITPTAGTIQAINWTAFPSSGKVGTPITGIADPVSVPAADSYNIVKKSGDCSWDSVNDALSFTNMTQCTLTVTTSKTGYNPLSKDFSITPSAGDIESINWVAFPSSGEVGIPITIMADPVSVPAADSYTIAKKSGDCSWDDSNDILSFTNTTECILTVTTTKTAYNSLSKDFSITPGPGEIQAISWVAFPSSGTVGTPITGIADPVSVPAADTYSITKKSGGCSWNDGTDTLSFSDSTKCTLTVTATKAGYTTKTRDFSVTPGLSEIVVTSWGSYDTSIDFAKEVANAPDLTGLSPTDVAKSYKSMDPNICFVDSLGSVSGLDNGTCIIRLVLSKTGYNERTHDYVFSVTGTTLQSFKGNHLFKGLVLGDYTKPVYADLDGDDDLDLVIGKGDGTLSYYLNESTESTVIFTEKIGDDNPFDGIDAGGHSAPIFADIDGDGDLELMIGATNGALKYYLNESTESAIIFLEKTSAENPFNGINVGSYSTPTFTDVDGDNKLDIVIGEYFNRDLNYYRNESAGGTITFTKKIDDNNPFNDIDPGNNSTPTFADIDGDGDQDLVIGQSDGTLKYYRKNATNSSPLFTELTSTNNPFNGINVGNFSAPTFADIDGDDKLDLVIGERHGTLKYYLNESTETVIAFTDKTESNNPFNGIDVGNLSAPTFADIDGDGDSELVVGTNDGTLKYYLNESTESTTVFTEKTSTENPFDGIDVGLASSPAFADINGDNKPDLVLGRSNGELSYYLNESTGSSITFTEKRSTENPFDSVSVGTHSTPVFADINGDDKMDLIVGELNGNLNYYLNESTGGTIVFTEKTGTHNPFNHVQVGLNSTPTFADINGDNKIDLIVGLSNGTFYYYLNESTESSIVFTQKRSTENPFFSLDVGNNSKPTFADIDGEGNLAMMVGRNNGDIYYIINLFDTWVSFL